MKKMMLVCALGMFGCDGEDPSSAAVMLTDSTVDAFEADMGTVDMAVVDAAPPPLMCAGHAVVELMAEAASEYTVNLPQTAGEAAETFCPVAQDTPERLAQFTARRGGRHVFRAASPNTKLWILGHCDSGIWRTCQADDLDPSASVDLLAGQTIVLVVQGSAPNIALDIEQPRPLDDACAPGQACESGSRCEMQICVASDEAVIEEASLFHNNDEFAIRIVIHDPDRRFVNGTYGEHQDVRYGFFLIDQTLRREGDRLIFEHFGQLTDDQRPARAPSVGIRSGEYDQSLDFFPAQLPIRAAGEACDPSALTSRCEDDELCVADAQDLGRCYAVRLRAFASSRAPGTVIDLHSADVPADALPPPMGWYENDFFRSLEWAQTESANGEWRWTAIAPITEDLLPTLYTGAHRATQPLPREEVPRLAAAEPCDPAEIANRCMSRRCELAEAGYVCQ